MSTAQMQQAQAAVREYTPAQLEQLVTRALARELGQGRGLVLREVFVLGGLAVSALGASVFHVGAGLLVFGLGLAGLGLWSGR